MPRRAAYCRLGWKPADAPTSSVHSADGLLTVQVAGACGSGADSCMPTAAARPMATSDTRTISVPSKARRCVEVRCVMGSPCARKGQAMLTARLVHPQEGKRASPYDRGSGAVVGVDADVVVRQIAGPHLARRGPTVQVDAHGD